MLSLHCYFLGDNPSNIFAVEIEETKNVAILKDAIKENNSTLLKDVDARNLILWKVDLPDTNLKKDLDDIILDDNNSLSPLDYLSEVFLAPTPKGLTSDKSENIHPPPPSVPNIRHGVLVRVPILGSIGMVLSHTSRCDSSLR
jgi:hypothetical protein